MTREEYEEICSKYTEFLIINNMGSCYIKKSVDINHQYPVYAKVADWFSETDNPNITSQTWAECGYDKNLDIVCTNTFCLETKDKYKFDENLQLFVKNYKNALIEFKKEQIKKEFENG